MFVGVEQNSALTLSFALTISLSSEVTMALPSAINSLLEDFRGGTRVMAGSVNSRARSCIVTWRLYQRSCRPSRDAKCSLLPAGMM